MKINKLIFITAYSILAAALILNFTGCDFSPSTKEDIEPLVEVNQNFDETFDSDMWVGSGFFAKVIDRDPLFAQWPQYGDALVDTHGKVFQLGTWESWTNNKYGNSSLRIEKISVTEESVLSFDYRCDLYKFSEDDIDYENYFAVYVDEAKQPAFKTSGYRLAWKKGCVTLSPGTHSITFAAKYGESADTIYCNPSLTNSVFLDNITLAPDKIASVDIYPKGLQETYIGGDSIQFSAKALRSDGSEITGKNIIWNSTGGNVDSTGLFTPGEEAGTFSVTATIDGLSGVNQTVKVHGENYAADPVTINGHTYTGAITEGKGTFRNTEKITWADPTPKFNEFTADGFFVLKGNVKGISGCVSVIKIDPAIGFNAKYPDDYPYHTYYYFSEGDFEKRIWLRFGDGDYEIDIIEYDISYADNYEGYEGAIKSFNAYSDWVRITVHNKTDVTSTAEQCAYIMPSEFVQSDDFIVSNAFNAVMAELPATATVGQKLQALYDWELQRSHYDMVSVGDDMEHPDPTKRKKQDSVHVIKYGMGVCEGYANLYTALARLCGVPSAYQVSEEMKHGWTECLYNGKWLLVDPTWDDPSYGDDTEKYADRQCYNYFLIDRTGIEQDHYKNVTDYSRSAKKSILPHSHRCTY